MLSSLCHPPALIKEEVEKRQRSHGRATRKGRGLEHSGDKERKGGWACLVLGKEEATAA